MKKTLIALAVITMFSSAANAAVIYEKEGTKIDIDGRMHFELRNDSGKRSDLQDAGSRVRVRAFQEIGNGFSTYGAVEFRFSKKDGSEQSIGSDLRAHRFLQELNKRHRGINFR